MPKSKSKKIRRILDNGREQILTIENGQVISKKTVRRSKKKSNMNVFDPLTKVEMFD